MEQHAVVLGAGVSGLLAARVLRDHFRKVTILERDRLPELGVSRKGVPQDRHAHVLLARGASAIERFFPGFMADMRLLGGQIANVLRDGQFVLEGQRLPQLDGDDMVSVLCARPLLEGYLRQRLLEEGGVAVRERCEVSGLIGDFARVRGVRLYDLERPHDEELLDAKLVVDATGRGSRLPKWLEELGHRRPEEERVQIELGYVSALYRRVPGMNLGTMISVVPPARRAGTILTIDQERVLVTLCGYLREYPISDHRAMLEFARGLAAPDIADFLQHAEPLTTPVPFRFPSSRRLRYERVRGYPQGAIAFGDALCSFNPVYGQGMTVAALEAELLTQLLARGEPFDFVRAFYREAARVVDAPWALSTGGDLRFVGATGQRALRLMGRYFTRLACAASEHPQTARKLLRVLQLVERPSALFGPNLIARALLRRAAPPTRVSLPRDLTISGVRS